MRNWTVSDISNPIEEGSILEIPTSNGDDQDFILIVTAERVVFGGACNVGFLESGYIVREEGESLDETLGELVADLTVFYSAGPKYVTRIVCNERM